MDWLDHLDLAIAPDRLGLADFPNLALDLAVNALVRLNSTHLAVASLHLLYCAVRPFGLVHRRNRFADDHRSQRAEC
jgi:hypothetical protein